MEIEAVVTSLKRAQTTNSTDTSYTARRSTVTRPAASATRSVFDVGQGPSRTTAEIWPVGGNDNNDVVNYKVVGWNKTISGLYVKTPICEIQATLSSTLVGVASQDVIATEFFADTITLTSGAATIRTGVVDEDEASILVDISGFELWEILYKLGAGGDVANALVRTF